MKKTKYTLWILLVICMIAFNVKLLEAQGNLSNPAEYPIEKVSLMTDRNLYISGETLWFTATCSMVENNSLHNISQILYIELYNAENKIFDQEKFKLTNGRVSGFIHIPEELPTDNYFLRGYTMYLRNFSPESYTTLCLTVINPEFPPEQTIAEDSLEVFTENEKLVAGVQNKVSFHLPGNQVHKVSSAGVYDTSGVFTAQVKIFNNGLGSGTFVPDDTTNYYLKVEFEDKDSLVRKLPDVKKGWIATTRITGDKLYFRMLGNGIPEDKGPFQFSIWSQNYRLLFRDELSIENLKNGIERSANILEPGINYLVLNSIDGKLISFSPLFANQEFVNGPEIILTKQSFQAREKVELMLSPDSDENAEIDFLQMSVVKSGTTFNPDSTLQAVYLANPFLLREAVDQPLSQNMEAQINAVLLMHTATFRDQFQENSKVEIRYLSYVPDIWDVSVSGIVKDRENGEPVAGLRVYASVLHDDFQFHSSVTGAAGEFVFSLPHLQGKHDLFLSTEAVSAANVEIFLNNDFSAQFMGVVQSAPEINFRNRALIEELLVNQQVSLNFAGVNETQMEPIDPLPPWIRTDLITIVLSDYIPLSTIQEVFNEIVTWVRLKEKNGVYKLSVFDDQSQLTYDDPMVLLDGIPITDISVLTKLYPAQVEQIKVLNRVFVLGDLTIRGLVSIRTKTDNFGGVPLPDYAIFVNYKTRSVPAAFHLPDELPADLNSPNPWFKTLLYFNAIDTLTAERKSFEFYTSDHQSEYDIIVKGKARDGRLLYSKRSFSVRDD